MRVPHIMVCSLESCQCFLDPLTAVPAVLDHPCVIIPPSCCHARWQGDAVLERRVEGVVGEGDLLLRGGCAGRGREVEGQQYPQACPWHGRRRQARSCESQRPRPPARIVPRQQAPSALSLRLLPRLLLPVPRTRLANDMAPLAHALRVVCTSEVRDGFSIYTATADQEWSGTFSPSPHPHPSLSDAACSHSRRKDSRRLPTRPRDGRDPALPSCSQISPRPRSSHRFLLGPLWAWQSRVVVQEDQEREELD